MSEDFEELEQIPWAALAAAPSDARVRNIALAVGAGVVAAAIGWFVLRTPEATVTLETSAPVAPPPTAEIVPAPVATSPPPVSGVYSEADLMLIDVGDEKRLAAMHAEWLVRDLLTIDGDPVVADRVTELLPGLERGDGVSYVEWAEAFEVTSPEPGRYRIGVVFRTLTGGEDGFVREPAQAVAVEIAIDVGGDATLLSQPEVISLPTLLGLDI